MRLPFKGAAYCSFLELTYMQKLCLFCNKSVRTENSTCNEIETVLLFVTFTLLDNINLYAFLILTYHLSGFSNKSNSHRLLEAGLNPQQPDSAGMTPVHCCALLGSLEAFQCLPADTWFLPEDSSGRCALHFAGISGNMDIVRYIVESGI